MATRPYWNELVTCPILWYILMPNWSRWRVISPRHYYEPDLLCAFIS